MFIPGSELSPPALDAAMRAALADSLAHIHAAAARSIDIDADTCARCLSAIKTHRVKPGVFGRYYDIVFALQERRFTDAGALFREIAILAGEEPTFQAVPFTDEALGRDKERYQRLVGLESEAGAELTSPSGDDWRDFQANIAAAMALLDRADPALAVELRTLLAEVVAVGLDSSSGGRGFSGASSFMLWGAVILNAPRHRARLDVVGGLVHEAAHQFLFGLSIDRPLAENPLSERYGSPLRTDKRPMDGILHATFVCARIHYVYARLRGAGDIGLDDTERRQIDQRVDHYRQKFFDGCETVERSGRLSEEGRGAMSSALSYMRSAN